MMCYYLKVHFLGQRVNAFCFEFQYLLLSLSHSTATYVFFIVFPSLQTFLLPLVNSVL